MFAVEVMPSEVNLSTSLSTLPITSMLDFLIILFLVLLVRPKYLHVPCLNSPLTGWIQCTYSPLTKRRSSIAVSFLLLWQLSAVFKSYSTDLWLSRRASVSMVVNIILKKASAKTQLTLLYFFTGEGLWCALVIMHVNQTKLMSRSRQPNLEIFERPSFTDGYQRPVKVYKVAYSRRGPCSVLSVPNGAVLPQRIRPLLPILARQLHWLSRTHPCSRC